MKKGQGLSLNTVVVAALVLLVLVVLVVIFRTQMGNVNEGFTDLSKGARDQAKQVNEQFGNAFECSDDSECDTGETCILGRCRDAES